MRYWLLMLFLRLNKKVAEHTLQISAVYNLIFVSTVYLVESRFLDYWNNVGKSYKDKEMHIPKYLNIVSEKDVNPHYQPMIKSIFGWDFIHL